MKFAEDAVDNISKLSISSKKVRINTVDKEL